MANMTDVIVAAIWQAPFMTVRVTLMKPGKMYEIRFYAIKYTTLLPPLYHNC